MKLGGNIIANLIGKGWITLMGFLFIPVYIRYIGIDAYGLLGVFATFQSILNLLDVGLTTTLNRELAKHNALPGHEQFMKNFSRTLEVIYLSLSVLGGIILAIISLFGANDWVKSDHLSSDVITNSFILMSINFAVQFPLSLYEGGLMGLQKQVQINIILIAISTAKALGAVAILAFVSPTIYAFLIWQIGLSLCQFLLLRYTLWKQLPRASAPPRFDVSTIKQSGRYALGIAGISGLAVLLSQSDKIILSRIVKLNEFGYYTLASLITSSLSLLLVPIISAFFPKLTELLAKQNTEEAKRVFHNVSQLVAVLIIPLGVSICVFSNDLIFAWTHNSAIAKGCSLILKFLMVGAIFKSLMTVPYQYTLAVGWIRYGININTVALFTFLPAIIFAALKYGIVGSAFMLMMLHIINFIFAMNYLFNRHLTSEKWKWYLVDVAKPFLVCIIIAIPFTIVRSYFEMNNILSIVLWSLCFISCFLGTAFMGTSLMRYKFLSTFNGIKKIKVNIR